MRYKIRHETVYTYSQSVTQGYNRLHLAPRDLDWQRCFRFDLQIRPDPTILGERIDFFGNRVTFFSIQSPHTQLSVHAESEVEVLSRRLPPAWETPPWEYVRNQFPLDLTPGTLEAAEFCFDSRHVPRSAELAGYAHASFPPGRPILEAVLDLTARIYRDFEYRPQTTTISTTLPEVMRQRSGVCQDFAHLQIGCLRSLGLAARYVSGYLRTVPPPGQQRLIGADASHAWLSVYIPSFGWIDLDPTNNQLVGEEHITLAWGRDYDDVSPIRGVVLGGGLQTITVSVDVEAMQ